MNIHLVLTHHWFDEVKAGRKNIEYREIKPHWTKLIWERRNELKKLTLSRGYTKVKIVRNIIKIDKGKCPYENWEGEYYRIHHEELKVNQEVLF